VLSPGAPGPKGSHFLIFYFPFSIFYEWLGSA
jgi:hypothetical protein